MDNDDLTGLFARKQFDADLAQYSAAADAEHPLSLLFIDLDLFKNVNDLYGHEAGDEVLSEAGRLLQGVCGERGRSYRRGGDEFAILLPDCGMEDAGRIAEDIRSRSEQARFQQSPDVMTVSIGVACFPQSVGELNALFLNADTMMYRAKGQGGNCVWPVSNENSRGKGDSMRYMRGDITSRVDALELWVSRAEVHGKHYDFLIENDSDEEVFVEGVSLRVGTLYLVRFGKSEKPGGWTIAARSTMRVSGYFNTDATYALQSTRPELLAGRTFELDIVVRGRVLGRLRTFSHTILAIAEGQSIRQWLSL